MIMIIFTLFALVIANVPEVNKHIVNGAGDGDLLLRSTLMMAARLLPLVTALLIRTVFVDTVVLLLLLGILINADDKGEYAKSQCKR
jgi:hypothetical protein